MYRGPSRFAIWKSIANESIPEVSKTIVGIFRERGPPEQLLVDNSATFKSHRFVSVCKDWNVSVIYRAAYRPSGNGIVERNHRTIKRMAARTGRDPLEMVFWYNYAPLVGTDAGVSPHAALHTYSVRCPLERKKLPDCVQVQPNAQVGRQVLVKPRDCRCTTPWKLGEITSVTDQGAVEVDGVHRHVADFRELPGDVLGSSDLESEEEEEIVPIPAPRRGERVRAQPHRYSSTDYE